MSSFTKYFSTPSDRMGFLWTLTSIENAYVIEFGPAGTTHFALEGAMELGAEHKMSVFTTHMSDVDITFGKHDKLVGAIKEVFEKYSPKYIFVMASSVSSLIGIDIESICIEMQSKVSSRLIPVTTGGYDGDYGMGIENALLSIVQNIVKENEKQDGFYNILGCNIDSYNFSSDRIEVERMLKGVFDLELNTCFTAYTSIDSLENAAKAKYNIVLRREGLPAAKYMQEKYNIPYVYKKPYGIKGTMSWLEDIAKTFDLKVNMDYIKEQTSYIKTYLQQYKSYLRSAKNKNIVICADFDTANGFASMAEDFGLVPKVYVKNESPSDDDLKNALLDSEIYAVFGEDNLRMLYSEDGFFQISNPNMDKYNFYTQTPFTGFNGILFMLQELMNFERRKARR